MEAEAEEAEKAGEAGGAPNASEATAAPAKVKIRKKKVPVGVAESYDGLPARPVTEDEVAHAVERLGAMDDADSEVKKIEAVKNTLEAFVYESREKLSEDELVQQVSTEESRDEIRERLSQTEDRIREQLCDLFPA